MASVSPVKWEQDEGERKQQMVALFSNLRLVKMSLYLIFDLQHWQKVSVLIQEGSFEKRH